MREKEFSGQLIPQNPSQRTQWIDPQKSDLHVVTDYTWRMHGPMGREVNGEMGDWGSSPRSATVSLCDPRLVPSPLFISVSPPDNKGAGQGNF